MPPRRKPLRSTAGIARRRRINPVSKKRQAENRRRAAVIHQLGLDRGPACELQVPGVCTGRWQHGHELVRRSQGGSITDPDNILLACDPCNGWVADHPFEAAQLGLSKWSWERAS